VRSAQKGGFVQGQGRTLYYKAIANHCSKFYKGACVGTGNNFESKFACETKCQMPRHVRKYRPFKPIGA